VWEQPIIRNTSFSECLRQLQALLGCAFFTRINSLKSHGWQSGPTDLFSAALLLNHFLPVVINPAVKNSIAFASAKALTGL